MLAYLLVFVVFTVQNYYFFLTCASVRAFFAKKNTFLHAEICISQKNILPLHPIPDLLMFLFIYPARIANGTTRFPTVVPNNTKPSVASSLLPSELKALLAITTGRNVESFLFQNLIKGCCLLLLLRDSNF